MHSSFISIASGLIFLLFSVSSAVVSAEQKVLIMGDSLSAAYNIEIQHSWPYLLQKKYTDSNSKIKLINASISGETTFGGKNRINALLEQHQPNILVIELGGNDGLRGLNFKISESNIKQMVSAAKQQDIKVLLIGVRLPPNLGKRYNQKFQQMYQSIHDDEDIDYLPTFLKGVAEHANLMQQDGIHPTAEAQPILQRKVYQSLQKLL